MDFRSYSQAGQDTFVYRLLVKPENKLDGTFLDIGCCHPTENNNTYGLEQLGWHGVLLDQDSNAIKMCTASRVNPAFCVDAATWDYSAWSSKQSRPYIDYLSLDCDHATLDILRSISASSSIFRAITIEHDFYRFGALPRTTMRQLLFAAGYDLLCADVSDRQLPFEDWWVKPNLVDMYVAERFRSNGLSWQEIMQKSLP